ncbi:hypothetical protein GUJ93_ZPchr0013g37548 [Zizania palustris]|uniref:Trehalose 6-phosphate phosphatase n=1 Tax=Zizania palustris TaxID=103762 RepID=A0A8J5X1D6_ZIZPA|nr:hypothetical protein GUJ93_ZPchr0013g37548 [Zizania palustris]
MPLHAANGSSSGSSSDPIYRAWTKKYPSALNAFDQIVACGKGKKIALFLDYDSTLSPIVDEPDNAVMSDQMREVVRNAALRLPTAIISGRSRDNKNCGMLVAMEWTLGPVGERDSVPEHWSPVSSNKMQGKEEKIFQAAPEFLPMINEVFRLLVDKTDAIDGVKDWRLVAECTNDVMKLYPRASTKGFFWLWTS